MNKTLMGMMAILPFLAGTALAGQPLTDTQMDKVTAGHVFSTVETTNQTFVMIDIDQPFATTLPSGPTGSVSKLVGAVTLPAANMQIAWGIFAAPPPAP